MFPPHKYTIQLDTQSPSITSLSLMMQEKTKVLSHILNSDTLLVTQPSMKSQYLCHNRHLEPTPMDQLNEHYTCKKLCMITGSIKE